MGSNEIFTTQDGSHSVISPVYGVSYHSRYGAIQESRHVFLESGLYYLLPQKSGVTVLEMGFGTGLNALLTLLASANRGVSVHYTAYELNPLAPDEALSLNYPTLLQGPEADSSFRALHQSDWEKRLTSCRDFNWRNGTGISGHWRNPIAMISCITMLSLRRRSPNSGRMKPWKKW